MALRVIRSRLRSTEDDQSASGSPRNSIIQSSLEAECSGEADTDNIEEQLLNMVIDRVNEEIRPEPSPRITRLQKSAHESVESDREGGESNSDELPIRGRTYTNEKLSRRGRFGKDKYKTERSKSLDRTTYLAREDRSSTPSVVKNKTITERPTLPHKRIAAWARELIDDLQEIEGIEEKDDEANETPLSIKQLKTNIMRFGRATRPVGDLTDKFGRLKRWESPTSTALFLLVVSYAFWHGYLLTLLVTISIWQMTLNYFITQGWSSYFKMKTKDKSEDGNGTDRGSGVADKLALIIQVARNVQNQLGSVCDVAEKIKNLLMWKHEATRTVYVFLLAFLPVSIVLNTQTIISCAVMYGTVRLFVLDYIFLRFPRLRAKYDSSSQLWQTLPTDADLEQRKKTEQKLSNTAAANQPEMHSFSELFSLPNQETPLLGWQNGLRCTLVNRDKSLTSSMKTGRLFLTPSYLCFERSKTHPQKNIIIPLATIIRLEKGNQYSWIPGGGMIIEVFVKGADRAYTFGAIMSRDDVFAGIKEAAQNCGCIWEDGTNPLLANSPAL